MLGHNLPAEKLAELRAAHRSIRDGREVYRIKAVALVASGWWAENLADVLLVDPNTARNHFKTYQAEGLSGAASGVPRQRLFTQRSRPQPWSSPWRRSTNWRTTRRTATSVFLAG